MNKFIKAAKEVLKEFLVESKQALNDFRSIKTIKKQIPNIFTFSRLLLVPFIVANIAAGSLITAGILTATASLTDLIDGFLARKLNVTSEFGRKLDAAIDKIFVVSVALPLAIIQPLLLLPIALDGVIASINGYAHLKGYNPQTSNLGKKKTVALDALVSSSFFASIPVFIPISITLYVATIGLQIKTGQEYYKMLVSKKKEATELEHIKLASTVDIVKTDNEKEEKKIEFNQPLSDKQILQYCKEQCCKKSEQAKDKQIIIKKNDVL